MKTIYGICIGRTDETIATLNKKELWAYKDVGTNLFNINRTFKQWPTRAALALTIRMQEKREHLPHDWHPVIKLDITEGY